MKRFIQYIVCLVSIASLCPLPVIAQSEDETRQRVNENTVYLVGGSLTGTNSALAWDMAKLFDDGYDLRVLPILGRGSIKTTEDILYLKGVDAGMVQADVLEFFAEIDIFPDIKEKLKYISAMHQEEVHVVVRRDAGYRSIDDLDGKKVNFGPITSGTFLTSSVIFDRKGVVAEALTEPYDFAIEKLKDGEIDALMRIAGAPTDFVEKITWESGLTLLPLHGIGAPYQPATLTDKQYPGLIAPGGSVLTVAVPSVLVAFDHKDQGRRARVDNFVREFRARLPELKTGASFHEKWKDVDIEAEVTGWTRWSSTVPDS